MNAVATETLGRACVDRGIERLVFASSCSLYDGLPPGMHDETAPIEPRGAYATSKRYGEEALLELVGRGPVPGDPPQRNGLRLQPADAVRPRRQHIRQGRAARRSACSSTAAAGCGGRWSTSATSSDAMIAALEAPAGLVRGEIFNVLHSNYQIRELAMLVAGRSSCSAARSSLSEAPAPPLTRDYECSNAKLAQQARVQPEPLGRRGGVDLLAAIDLADRTRLTDPRHYNIRWLELLTRSSRSVEQLRRGAVSEPGADHGRRRPARLRPRAAARRRRATSAPPRRELDVTDDAAVERASPSSARGRLQLRRLPQRRGLRARGGPQRSRSTPARSSGWPSAAPRTARGSST